MNEKLKARLAWWLMLTLRSAVHGFVIWCAWDLGLAELTGFAVSIVQAFLIAVVYNFLRMY